jgi:dTDP-L-rhamnose 4-epimerase
MNELVLITGGAGFIGSHTADRLLADGYRVRVLDAMLPQVHGNRARPEYLAAEVELQVGDVCDAAAVSAALDGVSYVYHFAAETGVGQSMYAVQRYFSTNVLGTATLWQEILARSASIKKVVLSSSRAVYGEGKYFCAACQEVVYPPQRSEAQLASQCWWHHCANCNEKLIIAPTDEKTPLSCTSVYGLTKKMQEEICTLMSQTSGVPAVILRYFNVYGPRQALSNPYTGIIANFCTRLMNGKQAVLYEQGWPLRDFVHVSDVAKANVLALKYKSDGVAILNIGSGQAGSLRDVAQLLCRIMSLPEMIETTTKARVGDIFGCYADLEKSRQALGYEPTTTQEQGLAALLPWLESQQPVDRSEKVERELRLKGILKD